MIVKRRETAISSLAMINYRIALLQKHLGKVYIHNTLCIHCCQSNKIKNSRLISVTYTKIVHHESLQITLNTEKHFCAKKKRSKSSTI